MDAYITEKDILNQQISDGLSLIGKEPALIKRYMEDKPVLYADAISGYKAQGDCNTYPGTVSLNFDQCYGHITAEASFGDNRRWAFDSDFWGMGFGYTGGAGISVWADGFTTPSEGERMNFEIVPSLSALGAVQIFLWREGGPIIGSFLVGTGGAGLVGGGGTGVWTRK